MVNGKPNLTFGNAPTTGSGSLRQPRARNALRGGGDFAAYLPAAPTGAAGAAQGSVYSGAVQNTGRPMLVQTGPSGALPAQQGAPLSFGGAGLPQSYAQIAPVARSLPSAYQGAVMPAAPQAPSRQPQAPVPAGSLSRGEARGQARPGDPGMAVTHSRGGVGGQSQRLSAKSSPRISTDRPITGRSNIGMVDTRKTAAGNTTLTGRSDLGYASPNANAARAGSLGQQPRPFISNAVRPETGYTNDFSSFQNRLISYLGPQSFANQGFAGKNAEAALQKLGYDTRDMRNITTKATRLDQEAVSHTAFTVPTGGPYFAGTRPIERETGADATRTSLQTAANRRRNDTPFHGSHSGLGELAAKFESGADGIAAIGYDGKGGTSYGKYQIASRVGTMSAFLNYLEDKAPDLAARLKGAGPANTGSRRGRMPSEWQKIAAEEPGRFEALQSDFIRTSHFEPAMQAIAATTGVAFERLPEAYQEVLFSTAVQHGPSGATRIVSQALQKVDAEKLHNQAGPSGRKAGEQLICRIYDLRAGQFLSSTSHVRSAVRSRLRQEMREALDMLS